MTARKKKVLKCACVCTLVCPNGIRYIFFSSLLLPRAQAQLCSAITLYYCASTVTASLSNLFIEAHGLWSNVTSSPTSTVVRAEEWVVPQSPFHQLQGKGGFRGCPYRPPAPGVSFSRGQGCFLAVARFSQTLVFLFLLSFVGVASESALYLSVRRTYQ